ncbi:MAG TPA: DUF6754 domain-containing protein [Candidatus Limnocylindria bacterium]|jgi:hypothetical protein|nr:DUF6754 domain-containing protein [Candidatus Limnocylindria bacterium]
MDLGRLAGDVIAFIGAQIGASSLRLGPLPTLALLAVLLVLLSLVARPSTRWMVRDLGRLAAVSRMMAVAAEAGGEAAFSLGTAGVARATSAHERLQTLAVLPILAHAARAAARAGVPLRVTGNDIVAIQLADSVLTDAHAQTDTAERRHRAQAAFIGEGRPVAAAHAMAERARPAAAFADGGMAEESLLLLDGIAGASPWSSFGSASASQLGSVLLEGDGTLIGPELYQAASDVRAGGHERTGVLAANRLLTGAVVVIVVGSAVALAGGIDLAAALAGR